MQFNIVNIIFFIKFNKCILWVKFFSVRSKNLHIKGESSAWLAVDFKISHFFAGDFKLSGVFYVYNCGVEWLRYKISVDLRLGLEGDSCILLKCFFNFYTLWTGRNGRSRGGHGGGGGASMRSSRASRQRLRVRMCDTLVTT